MVQAEVDLEETQVTFRLANTAKREGGAVLAELAISISLIILFFSGIIGINNVLQERFRLSLTAFYAARAASFQTLRTGAAFDPTNCANAANVSNLRNFFDTWFNTTNAPPETQVERDILIQQFDSEDPLWVDFPAPLSADLPYASGTDEFTLETAPVVIRVRLTRTEGLFNNFSNLLPFLPDPVGEAIFPISCAFNTSPPNAQVIQ